MMRLVKQENIGDSVKVRVIEEDGIQDKILGVTMEVDLNKNLY